MESYLPKLVNVCAQQAGATFSCARHFLPITTRTGVRLGRKYLQVSMCTSHNEGSSFQGPGVHKEIMTQFQCMGKGSSLVGLAFPMN